MFKSESPEQSVTVNLILILAKASGNWKNCQMAENAKGMGKIQEHWKGNL